MHLSTHGNGMKTAWKIVPSERFESCRIVTFPSVLQIRALNEKGAIAEAVENSTDLSLGIRN